MISRKTRAFALTTICGLLVACNGDNTAGENMTSVELGERLFSDANLSMNRTQSCATCHNPDAAFVDPRPQDDGKIRAGSLGDDGESVGDRNAPTAAYAQFSPPFSEGTRKRFNTDGDFSTYEGYLGGQFHDGRAATLADQAAGPPLNPGEMGMPDEEAVVERLMENADYADAFQNLYGDGIWDDTSAAYAAMTEAIADFEKSSEFAPFDSIYDRSLLTTDDEQRYTYDPGSKAAQGKALFFSTEFTNCSACHQLHPQSGADAKAEVFTGFEYHNLGVPVNQELRELSGGETDLGLSHHVDDDKLDGTFKTPTLRNIAITSPYMHNGVFRELSTVIRFYEHTKLRARGDSLDTVNPETGEPFDKPEVERNLSDTELGSGNKDLSDDANVEALECFLMTLTDARYEERLDEKKVKACGI